ncbi:centrosomal protein of 41 kDa-like [Halichondria panicea]|uniref:centrosomal protein of 41 kDa-like n=1 Tax=Halichondria panicea TaxID=6063 RepID=UPI00312B2C5F
MSFSSRSSSGKGKPLNKRIPENPKYKHIKSSIDTGASVSKYVERLEEMKRNYRYRNDEIFKRLKVTTFAQLILQVAEVDDVESPVPSDSIVSNSPIISPAHFIADYPESPPDTARSTLSSVISGVGELDIISHGSNISPPSTPVHEPASYPYLLLDVRCKEDYDQCHIISAKNYPVAMLSRSCNYFTKDILDYQNKPGKIIVLYDEDERIAPNAATTFVQRGIDNVFMLSGGIKVLYKTFPEGMLSGVVPGGCKITSAGSGRTKALTFSLSAKGSAVHRDTFTLGDLSGIQDKLDDAFLLSSRASSRTSSSSSHRSLSASSRIDSAKPWK